MANHALVMAKLLVDGKNLGQHFFMVRLRRQTDHSLLPGIDTGDIGPKHGYTMKDNGYATFNQVRIPRFNMLMGYQELDRKGLYRKKGNPKILYIQVLLGRVVVISSSSRLLAMALLITLRYCSYRKQFRSLADRGERKTLDYELVQHRLIPYLADAFAYFFLK